MVSVVSPTFTRKKELRNEFHLDLYHFEFEYCFLILEVVFWDVVDLMMLNLFGSEFHI